MTATAVSEEPMEARIARLEADMTHVRSDISDMKSDVRALRDKIDSLGVRLNDKIDGLKDSLADIKVWALVMYTGLAAAMLATMARGFGWL